MKGITNMQNYYKKGHKYQSSTHKMPESKTIVLKQALEIIIRDCQPFERGALLLLVTLLIDALDVNESSALLIHFRQLIDKSNNENISKAIEKQMVEILRTPDIFNPKHEIYSTKIKREP